MRYNLLLYDSIMYKICTSQNTTTFRQQFMCQRKKHINSVPVLLTVHLSIFISVINQLDAQNFCFTISLFHASTCFEHHVLIIRRSTLHYTASGIITPIGVMIPEMW